MEAAGGEPVERDNDEPPEEAQVEKIWSQLHGGILKVYSSNPMGMSRGHYMELYSCVYNYALSTSWHSIMTRRPTGRHPEHSLILGLYERIKHFLESYLVGHSGKKVDLMNDDVLRFYVSAWEEYRFSSTVLDGICDFVNRTWTKRMRAAGYAQFFRIYDLTLILWKRYIISKFKDQITKSVLTLIEKARNGEEIDTGLIRVALSSFVEADVNEDDPSDKKPGLKTYKVAFEDSFLEATEFYYNRATTQYLQSHSVAEYLRLVDICLNEERRRVQLCMHESTLKPLLTICQKVLIESHLEVFYGELKNLLKSDPENCIGRLLKLVYRSNCEPERLKALFEEQVEADGQASIEKVADKALQDPKLYVCTLLEVYKKYTTLIFSEFAHAQGLVQSLDEALRRLVNNNAVTKLADSSAKSAELLARYCGSLLNKNSRSRQIQDFNDGLNEAMIVFQYLDDKDAFQNFYAKLCAKRLVNETSITDFAEKCMISKLKQACDVEYTVKLERLCEDAILSKDLSAEFKIYAENFGQRVQMDFTAFVIPFISWPFKEDYACYIPSDLQPRAELFLAFYSGKHKNRKLSWFHNVSWGDLAMRCPATTYTLRASMFQMAVLLQFNSEPNFTVQQLKHNTGIVMDTLLMVLQSLLKCRLLVRVEERSEGASSQATFRLEPNTLLRVNDHYCNKRVRININVPLKTELQAQRESERKSALEDRKMCIQATIVRIMKVRKTLTHEELVAEVLRQLSSRFKPDVLMIKAGIDILINKEYIERAPDEPDVYNYVA